MTSKLKIKLDTKYGISNTSVEVYQFLLTEDYKWAKQCSILTDTVKLIIGRISGNTRICRKI